MFREETYFKMVESPAAWYGSVLKHNRSLWTHILDELEVNELLDAGEAFVNSGTPLGKINPTNFKLRRLSDFLGGLQSTLKYGLGFQLISGLPVEDCSAEMRAAIFCGVGSHLGNARSQNAAGHLLGHVRDIGLDINDPKSRIYQTTSRQSFHTDSTDVVGLLCIKEAKEGGDSMLASSMTGFNEILKRRPDLVPCLFNPVATDRRGEVPEGCNPYFTIPVFNYFENHLSCIYQRNYINSAKRFDDAPKLTAEQIEALDLLDEIVNEPNIHLRMRLKPGDMQFVYNHTMLHDRTAFVDWPEKAQRRHLLRLWLALPNDRPLPPIYAERYGSIEIGNRGGVITKETVLHAPVEA